MNEKLTKETVCPANTSIMMPMMTTQAQACFIHRKQSNMTLDDKLEQWEAYLTALDQKWDDEMEDLRNLMYPFHLEEEIPLEIRTARVWMKSQAQDSKENRESKTSRLSSLQHHEWVLLNPSRLPSNAQRPRVIALPTQDKNMTTPGLEERCDPYRDPGSTTELATNDHARESSRDSGTICAGPST
jgi:hypothetical protein